MPSVYANTDDGYQGSVLGTSWDTVHDNLGGIAPNTTRTNYGWSAEAVYYGPPRSKMNIRRYFASFNTGLITTTLSEATLKLYLISTTFDNGDCIVLKSGHDNTNTSENWYSTWLTGLGGSLSGWNSSTSEVVAYSAEAQTIGQGGGGYFEIPLNSSALSDLVSLDTFKIVVMNYDYDYLDTAPPQGNLGNTGWYHADYTGTSRDPVIDYTVSTGYGNDVGGVASANIGSINGVATANISKVNGI